MSLEGTPGKPSLPLTTEFVRLAVPLQTRGIHLRDNIETALQTYGEPLRWAITAVEDNMAHVEAVVTRVAPGQS